ncbi:hypothetical protein [Wuchan romanomermis nematode virus 3]|uniref:hypothetical protein n=1 Tax=Wuchan romanomermis nematode virus 3 TaxID=1923687 RepID=UPI00090BE631|nr:hypothetical protein [Wuchan romanomermis nematode virus 3]APG75892.1 hypothetical protein [Wuchan romanomermis nematode virus 3]
MWWDFYTWKPYIYSVAGFNFTARAPQGLIPGELYWLTVRVVGPFLDQFPFQPALSFSGFELVATLFSAIDQLYSAGVNVLTRWVTKIVVRHVTVDPSYSVDPEILVRFGQRHVDIFAAAVRDYARIYISMVFDSLSGYWPDVPNQVDANSERIGIPRPMGDGADSLETSWEVVSEG